MRRTISIVIITLAIAGATIAAFGWPGWAIAIAIAPGLILGTTVAHVVDAWIGRAQLRMTFVMLGIVLGIFSAIIAVVFIGAATVSDQITIEHSRSIDLPPPLIWEQVERPTNWSQWDAWIGRIERTENADDGSERYTSTLMMGTTEVPAVHRLRERVEGQLISWHVALTPGSAMTNVTQGLRLEEEGEGTRATYTITYTLPSMTARALHAVMLVHGIKEIARKALENLEAVAREGDLN